MTAKWIPGDDELDAVARSLPPPPRTADRIEHERTSVLAQAAGLSQHKRVSRAPLVAAVATAFAAAAAVLIWFVVRPSEPTAKEVITALGPARYERTSGWPDFVVRLDDGRLSIQVATLAPSERFRATTSDGEVEVRGARFVIGAEHDRVTFVFVGEGRAEIRWAHEPTVIVAAGQTWMPPRIAQREAIDIVPPAPAPTPPAPTPAPTIARIEKTSAKKPHAVATDSKPSTVPADSTPSKVTADSTPSKVTADSTPSPVPAPTPPRPGEADFRAGVTALRAGDASNATRSFASACAAAQGDALAEDACFWVGAAAKRAGQTAVAREALVRFLKSFPGSARAGEASALLGWILYDAGELADAQTRFESAAKDRVPKVKESALKGLEAVKRKQQNAH